MAKREFDYYATIIYNSADEKWAKWIQRKLEGYRFPTSLRRENMELPNKIIPIFRDRADAPDDMMWEALKHQLDESEYLIVICSPKSAHDKWIEQEIAYFQEMGRNKNIIPLIVEGEPHSKDPERECYPAVLLNKGEDELLGISVSELGQNIAVLRVIASLMHLRFDQLVMRDKRRARRRKMIALGAALALLVTTAGILWYETPHTYYYWNYVDRKGEPAGLVKIDSRAQENAHDYIKIVKHKNKVIRLERINSVGVATDSLFSFDTDDYPITEFTYNEKGELVSATKEDTFGNIRQIQYYTQDTDAVDIQKFDAPGDQILTWIDSNVADPTVFEYTSQDNSIARRQLEYDKEGYLTKELYMWDIHNTPTCDADGIYGKEYVRDKKDGKILQVINLGEDDEPLQTTYGTSVVYTNYEYDDYGRVIKSSVYDINNLPTLDKKNVFSWECVYNDSGCIEKIICRDTEGNLCSDSNGISQQIFVCDENGFLMETYGCNENGGAAFMKDSGVCRTVYKTDPDDGRILGENYCFLDGSPMKNNYGYASESRKYDKQGRIVERWVYGVDGDLAYDTADGNYAGYTVQYPDEDTVQYTYYNSDGEIALCKDGYAGYTIHIKNNDIFGSIVECSYYDEGGNPMRARNNVASVQYEYNSAGLLVSESYFDENGKPCANHLGASVIEYGYQDWNMTTKQYFNLRGELCCVRYGGEVYARCEVEYDSHNRISRILCYDEEGNQIYAESVCERRIKYDEDGKWIRYLYCNIAGGLMDNSEGYAVRELNYGEKGYVVSEIRRDNEETIISNCEWEYDGRGNPVCSILHNYDKNDNETCVTTTYEYDERNRIVAVRESDDTKEDDTIEEYTYDENDQLGGVSKYTVAMENGEEVRSPIEAFTYTYDVYGNIIQTRHYDDSGNAIADSDGVAYTEAVYNAMGDILSESCYSLDGRIMLGSDGYATVETVYDVAGRPIQYNYYDEKGQPMTELSGYPAYKTIRWNNAGYKVEEIAYNETGTFLQSEEYGFPRVVFNYNHYGIETTVCHYDSERNLRSTEVCVVYITDVEEGSPADKAGLQFYDILLTYENWGFFNYESYNDINFVELNNIIVSYYNKEITVEVARFLPGSDRTDYTMRVLNYTLEAGGIGAHFSFSWIEQGYVELIKSKAELAKKEEQ